MGTAVQTAGGLESRGPDSATRQQFVQQYCVDCHSGSQPDGGLNLQELSTDLRDSPALAAWLKVHDRVAAGEMPPPESERPAAAATASFVNGLANWLTDAQLEQRARLGRVSPRRLTNLQLERSLQSLLGIDIPLAQRMPEEPRTGEYTTLAEKQSLSHYQLAEHLKVVDIALDEAFRRGLTPGDEWTRELTAEEISRTRSRTREPECIDGEAVIWSGRLAFYGRLPAITAKEDGWYRVTFPARSLKHSGEHGVWCSVRSGKCVSSAALLSWVGAFEATREQRKYSFEAWLPAGHMLEIRPSDQTLKQARFAGGQAADGEGGAQDVPGLAIAGLRLERIHQGPSDQQIRQLLFGDLEVVPHRNWEHARISVEDPTAAARHLIQNFASRAFRRPMEANQLAAFNEIFASTLETRGSFIDALRASYRAILCSARFMYFHEPLGPLDDYALASRLSYLLWNAPPDEDLLHLASTGQLSQPQELQRQVDRMLAVPAGKRFIVDFAAEWLELRDIGFTEPDPKLYRDFDMIVQASMLQETHAFLQYLLDEDRPVQQLIDSRETFLNGRLAKYYGIDGVTGDTPRLVELSDSAVRGGLLAQGAILKVTANGTNTSPVLRGVWISERLLGCTIPPPPEGVPAIEPDIRGATTIREQLEQHRQAAQCAACHAKIDPAGFALENFDAAGGWREVYPQLSGGKIKAAAAVEVAYTLADGTPFESFQEFRQLTAQQPQPLARNWVEQLLTYGTGARPEFADRAAVEQIVTSAAPQNYGLRSLLKAAVTSQLFRNN